MKFYSLRLGLTLSFIVFYCWCYAQNKMMWNGETSQIAFCDFSNGTADNSQPNSGQWAFKGSISQWAPGIIDLHCQNTWRIDLSNYSEIQFYVKINTPGSIIKMGLSGWPYLSNMVDIATYIQNGPNDIEGEYKLVKIPISVFKTQEYQLHAVETIRFESPNADPVIFYADDFVAVDTQPNQIDSIQLLSNLVIKLNVKDKYDMQAVQNLANYHLSSNDDPDYSLSSSPEKIGRHFYVKEFTEYSTSPKLKNELFLQFQKPLKKGKSYLLKVDNVKDLAGNNFPLPKDISFTYDDEKLINHSIKVNQVGYFTWGPKYGYIGNYMGDAGVLPVFPLSFELKSALTHVTIYNGIPEFRGNDPTLSGEKIFECDFSSFNTPGKYYLYVPGVGRSYDFEISETVMDKVYYTTARSIFYQRCGVALEPPFADEKWAHAACHLNDGFSHTSWSNSLLYNAETVNTLYAMPNGWHDAGDYGKYAMTGPTALYYLFTIYQLYPEKFADNELNIPESGNGVPDLLDEAKHEILWLMDMQAGDGGVFERVTSLAWPTGMPESDVATRYIAEKTTHTTGQFAAIMAMAYRNFLPFWPELANKCLAKSKLAFSFLQAHPSAIPENGYNPSTAGMGGGDYPDPEGDFDERAWAAAELYKATGDLNYRDLFDEYWGKHEAWWGWNPFQHHQINASVAYASTTFPTDQAKVTAIKNACLNHADQNLIARTDNNFYRSACRTDVIAYIGWGAYGQSSKYSWDLILAYYFSKDENYKKYALINLDVQLGNNPQNKSYITGVGSNYPMNPLHHPSLSDNAVEPVPGIPVFGPNSHLSGNNDYNVAVQDENNLYPLGENENDPYPVLRRYYDISSNVAMSEFNIIDEAITSSVYGFFKTAPLQGPPKKSSFKLSNFSGEIKQEGVLLKWTTELEQQISFHEVQRSKDGINFEPIVKLSSWGNSNSLQNYQYTDSDPLPLTSYYRLMTKDLDGNLYYSSIVTINFSELVLKTELLLYPNPVINQINLNLSPVNDLVSEWDLKIVDLEGNLFIRQYGNLSTLSEKITQVLSRMSPGVYILTIKKGQEEYKTKFIKQ